MSYSRPLTDLSLIHVDGSASGAFATTKSLRTTRRLAARTDASGTLRTYERTLDFGGRKAVAVEERPIAPGKRTVSCAPLGRNFSGGIFLRAQRR